MSARLPAIPCGGCDCLLPLAEPTADVLLAFILEPMSAQAHEAIVDSVATDPAFALWASYHHAISQPDDAPAPSLAELATWLSTHLAALLNSTDTASSADVVDMPAPAQLAALAATCVAAAAAGVQKHEPLENPCYLAVLLRSLSEEWLTYSGCTKNVVPEWPGWLGAIFRQPSASQTLLALGGSARGKRKSAKSAANSAKRSVVKKYPVGSLPERARQRWLVPPGFAARNFTILVARLAKLATLETHFEERLEEEKLEALAEFAAGAGHEINNPLAVISGRAQLFLRHEQDPERRRELAVINTQARRVHEMIADLMLFARPPQPRFAETDVTELIDTLVSELSPRVAEAGVAIIMTLPDDLPTIQADATQLKVATRAVVENSLEALAGRSEGGRIEITAALNSPPFQGGARGGLELSGPGAAQPTLTLTIHDNGPGMTADVRRHAFDPYYSGRGAGRGLGNGLSKCWRIVTAHGGRVEIDTTTAGTAVVIALPIVCESAGSLRQ